MLQIILALLAGGVAMAAGASSSGGSDQGDQGGDTGTPAEPLGAGTPGPLDPVQPQPSPDPAEPLLAEPAPPQPAAPQTEPVDHGLSWAGLTAEEQLVVELINRARMDPQAEVDRLSEPLAPGIPPYAVEPLAVTPELSAAARAHSEDMDDRNFFDHTNPDGDSPADRAIEAGHGSRYVGENIGWIASGRTPTGEAAQTRVEMHHANLWESDGHQRGLMNENFSEIGVGYDYGQQQGFGGSTHVTELFGDRGVNYLTGVVIRDGDEDDFYDMGEGLGGVRVTADNGTEAFGTSSWEAGGYTLALPAGTYRVTFEGGGLRSSYSATVEIGRDNVKLDVIEDEIGAVALTSAAAAAPPAAQATLADAALLPEIAAEDPTEPEPDADEDLDLLMI